MGPRSVERGNPKSEPPSRSHRSLQWGRVRLNAETRIRMQRLMTSGMLQWGRVRLNAETARLLMKPKPSWKASMGPRSVERGNEAGGTLSS